MALLQVAPEQSEEVFKIIQKLLEDKDLDIRQMTLDVFPKLVQVAPGWAQYALQIILSALQDPHGNVRKAALGSLNKLLSSNSWSTIGLGKIVGSSPILFQGSTICLWS